MKIAIPSTGKSIDSTISNIFGRCPVYIIAEIKEDPETGKKEIGKAEAIENPAVGQRGGAGIMASQTLGNEDVDIVIAPRIGPRAFNVLQKIGIEIYQASGNTVKQNLDNFLENKLNKINSPGQMGMGPKPGAGRGAGRGQGAGQGRGQGGGAGQGKGRGQGRK